MRRPAGGVDAVDHDCAARRLLKPGKHVDDRRFTRAVGADQAQNLAPAEGERNPVDGGEALEVDGNVSRLQQFPGRARRGLPRRLPPVLRGRARPGAGAGPEGPRDFPPHGDARRAHDKDDQHDQRDAELAHVARALHHHVSQRQAGLELAQELEQGGDRHHADDGAGQAALAADDEHREGDEGRPQPEGLDRDRADEVGLEHTADTHEEGAEDKGDEALRRHVDPHGARRRIVLARGPERETEAGLLVD